MKNLSLFLHPHAIPNLYTLLSSVELKRRYFKKCLSLSFWGHTMKVNGHQNGFILQNIYFCVSKKKESRIVFNNMRMNYHFKVSKRRNDNKKESNSCVLYKLRFSCWDQNSKFDVQSSVCKEIPQKKSHIRCHLGYQHFFLLIF